MPKDPHDSLKGRYWSSMRGEWLSVISRMPDVDITQLDLAEIVKARLSHSNRIEEINSGSIPEAVLINAKCWIQKGFHLYALSGQARLDGFLTWSLVEAYQASLFLGKGLLSLLGVGFCDIDGKTVFVDLVEDLRLVRRAQRSERRGFSEKSVVIRAGYRYDHKAVWSAVHRVLRTFDFGEASDFEKLRSYFLRISHEDFARQRNRLSYVPEYWVFEDLLKRSRFIDPSESSHEVQKLGHWFSVEVAGILYAMVSELLLELLPFSPWVTTEFFVDAEQTEKEASKWKIWLTVHDEESQ